MKSIWRNIIVVVIVLNFGCSHSEKIIYSTAYSTVYPEVSDTIDIKGYGTSEIAAKTVCKSVASRLLNVTVEKKEKTFTILSCGTQLKTPPIEVTQVSEFLFTASTKVATPARMRSRPFDTISFYMFFHEKPSLSSETEVSEHLKYITAEIMCQMEKHLKKALKKNKRVKLDFLYIDYDPLQQRVPVTIHYAIATMQ